MNYVSVLPSGSNPSLAAKFQFIATSKEWVNDSDAREINDAAAVDSRELGRVQPSFKARHCFID